MYPTQLNIDQLKHKLEQNEDLYIVDIRDAGSFMQGHLAGAKWINNDNLQAFIDERDFDDPILVVCYHGVSSNSVAAQFLEFGFTNVASLVGGMTAWVAAYPEHIVRDA